MKKTPPFSPIHRAAFAAGGQPARADRKCEQLLHDWRTASSLPSYHLFEGTGSPLKKLWACLDLSVTLVNSPNQKAGPGNSDYEFIEVATTGAQFTRFQTCLHADELVRPEIG